MLWALSDLALTGDPLFSLHATSTLADELGRERGIANVPTNFVSFLADTARPPVFAGGAARRGARLPGAGAAPCAARAARAVRRRGR